MDEPFAALDEITRFKLNNDLLQLWQDERCTVVFVTHGVRERLSLEPHRRHGGAAGPRLRRDRASTRPIRATRSSAPRRDYADACRQASDVLHGAIDRDGHR